MTYSADEGNIKGPSLMDLIDRGLSIKQAEATLAFGERVPVHEMINGEIDLSQKQLVPGLLYEGHNHHLFGPPASGKSWVALHLARHVMKKGGLVHYLDFENGMKVFAGRVKAMGLSSELAESKLSYWDDPPLAKIDTENGAPLYHYLLQGSPPCPNLIIFDSLSIALLKCGLKEIDNTEVDSFFARYLAPLSKAGVATLVLDHVAHDGDRPIGASTKKHFMDVQWGVSTEGFNRKKVGRVRLHQDKDRHGYFDPSTLFKIGGTPFTSQIIPENEEETVKLPKKERVHPVITDLKVNGPSTPEELAERIEGKSLKTIQNYISENLGGTLVEVTPKSATSSRVVGLAEDVQLVDSRA